MTEELQNSKDIISKIGRCGHFLHYKMDLVSGRTKILLHLLKRGDLLQRDLQKIINIKSGSMSDIIIKMSDEGLINRSKCKSDGRNLVISLTEKGKEESKKIKDRFELGILDLMSVLEEDEKKEFDTLLDKVLNHWESFEKGGV